MTERNQIIEKALQLTNPASKIGKDKNYLPSSSKIITHLEAEFPNADRGGIRLIVSRAIGLAMQGHDHLDREMFRLSAWAAVEALDSHKKVK
jgi:hypothetical protein